MDLIDRWREIYSMVKTEYASMKNVITKLALNLLFYYKRHIDS